MASKAQQFALSVLQSGARQLLVAGLAAAAAFGIGRLNGVSVR